MDPTEKTRKQMQDTINEKPLTKEALLAAYGQVWDTEDLRKEFDVMGFMAPFVVVRRKSDGRMGSLVFQHFPRFYFSFEAA